MVDVFNPHHLHLVKNATTLGKDVIICVKCNTNNPESQITCLNCGFKLKSNAVVTFSSGTPHIVIRGESEQLEVNEGRHTIFDHQVSTADTPVETHLGPCSSCGYPMSGISDTCPDCGHIHRSEPRSNAAPDTKSTVPAPMPTIRQDELSKIPTEMASIVFNQKDESKKETLSIFSDAKKQVGAILEPLELTQKESRSHGPIPIHGSGTSINRESIDANDNTLSAVSHASFEKINGQWFINNESSNKAVFVQVKNTTPLTDGDILLFGTDHFFVFREQEEQNH